MNLLEARRILKTELPEGSKIVSGVEYVGRFLFIAHVPDPLEGKFLPFFEVLTSGKVVDFSPQEFANPIKILTLLDAV